MNRSMRSAMKLTNSGLMRRSPATFEHETPKSHRLRKQREMLLKLRELASFEQEALYEIDAALKRIEDGTYGICELTGKPIPWERLEAIPWTRFSLEAQNQLGSHMYSYWGRPRQWRLKWPFNSVDRQEPCLNGSTSSLFPFKALKVIRASPASLWQRVQRRRRMG
jgi:RNA polymerase-binding transcription factor DksA